MWARDGRGHEVEKGDAIRREHKFHSLAHFLAVPAGSRNTNQSAERSTAHLISIRLLIEWDSPIPQRSVYVCARALCRRAACAAAAGPPCRHTRYLDPAYPVLATHPIVESLETGQTQRTTGSKKDFARPVTSSTMARFRYVRDA